MASRHMLFRLFYRVGFTPWDGHPRAQSLRNLVEDKGSPPLEAETALDLGCGTGDNSIYLAKRGWTVTGVDFVPKALNKAHAKARSSGVPVNFVHADVTRLSSAGLSGQYALIIDSGCLHSISADDRDAYVREVTAVATADARLLVTAFIPGGSFGVPGIDPPEMERRFAAGWTLESSGNEPTMDRHGKQPGRYYLFQRRP